MWLLGNSKYICGWHYISFGQCYSSLMLVIMAETIIKTLPPLGYLSPNYPRPQWIWALCTSIAPYPSILTLFHYTSIVCHSTRLQVSWGNRLDFFFLIPVYSSYSKGIKQIINVKWVRISQWIIIKLIWKVTKNSEPMNDCSNRQS